MSTSQINDDGAVIGYKPNLEYKKDNKATGKVNSSSSQSYNQEKPSYSTTLNNFSNNLPSKALDDIDYVIQNMKTLIDELSKSFSDGGWTKYNQISALLSAVDNKNNKVINEFIIYHKDLINGDIVPELIGDIYNTQERLEILSQVLKKLYYGTENISTEDAQEKDKVYVEQLRTYETTEQSKVNYLSLSYDALLNRSVSIYAYSANKKAIETASIIKNDTIPNTVSTKKSLITDLFTDINQDITDREARYELQQSVEIMQKTLYNYYDKRSKMQDMYDLYTNNSSNFVLMNKVYEYEQNLMDAVTNVNRNFVGNQVHNSEINQLEKEKYELKKIYSELSYNS